MVKTVQALVERAAVGGLAAAARKSGIPEALLRQAQSGSFEGWTTTMVERLARAAGIDPTAVWSGAPLPEVPTIAFLRGAWPDFSDADMPVLMEALEDAASLRALGVDVLKHPRLLDDGDRVAVSGRAHDHGYTLAALVRAQIGNPAQPLNNIHHVASALLHVHVVYRPLHTARLHAVTLMSSEGAAVVVNTKVESRAMMLRRTIAHELSHALFDPHEGNLFTVVGDDLGGEQEGAPVERRARAFAAELLVPKAGLLRLFGQADATRTPVLAEERVRQAVEEFRAPPELVALHLVNHGFVDRALKSWLVESVRGIHVDVSDPPENWLHIRTQEAVDTELISPGRAREILGLSVYDHDLVA